MKRTIDVEKVGESLYDADFFNWTQSIAESLRSGHPSQTDLEHVAEEIADMGKRDRREVRSRMTVLIMHLMKWATQPKLRKTSTWLATINEQRDQISGIFEDSPTLRSDLIEHWSTICFKAAKRASKETGLPYRVFATTELFSGYNINLDLLLSEDFFPDQIEDFTIGPG